MRRRAVWILIAAIVASLIVGAAVWLLLPREDVSARAEAHRTPEASTDLAATALAQEQLDAHLATCTAPASAVPASCGITIPWAADFASLSSIRYRVEQAPVLTLTPPTFRADDGILVATVAGIGLDGAAKTMTYRTQNWMLRGDVIVTPKRVALEVW